MRTLQRKWILLLLGVAIFLVLAVVAANTTYPPLFFRKGFTEVLSIYNTNCGVIDSERKQAQRGRSDTLRCDVYLLSGKDPGKPIFEGQNLSHNYSQSRDGYDVEGAGKVVWNKNVIEIEGETIRINGKPVTRGASCVTIEADGSFQEDRRARAY